MNLNVLSVTTAIAFQRVPDGGGSIQLWRVDTTNRVIILNGDCH